MNTLYELTWDDYTYHVAAPTRGKARLAFIEFCDNELEFTTPMSIRILAKYVDMPLGVDERYTWARKNHKTLYFWEFLEIFDDVACQECGHLLWESNTGEVFCPDCYTKDSRAS